MSDSGPDDDAAWAPRSPTPPPAPAGESPALVAGYRDFAFVARGGDSIVYRAHDETLDRDVAIKVVLLDDPESIARFRRELAITVNLGRQHPNILTVLATGTTVDGQPCLVTDYVELGSLHHRLVERGALPVDEVVAAGTVVADALAFAHAQGVLHRDVKPQNVLVLPTSYLLADFGLARAIDAGHSGSLERFSYRHASPQVLDGEPPTVADDIYSLGSTLFTLLDGRPPFAAEDPDEDSALSYLRRARTEAPRPVPAGVPAELADVVRRCLARARDDRFPDAVALRRALAAVPSEARGWAPDAPSTDAPVPVAAAPSEPEPVDAAPSEPAPPEPGPVDAAPPGSTPEPVPAAPAVSALAHLPRNAQRDAEPTGLGPRTDPVTDPDGPPDEAGEGPAHGAPGGRRRWPLLVVLAVAALAVGLVIGLRGGGHGGPGGRSSDSALGHGSGSLDPSRTGQQSVRPVPTVSLRSLPPTASVRLDPKLKPRITTMRRRGGDRLDLAWTDPSGGKLPFVVFSADPGQAAALITAPAHVTHVTLTQFPTGRHCLVVSTVTVNDAGTPVYGRGPTRCLAA